MIEISLIHHYDPSDIEKYRLDDDIDIKTLVHKYPAVKDYLYQSSDLKRIASNICAYLSNGYQSATYKVISEKPLDKLIQAIPGNLRKSGWKMGGKINPSDAYARRFDLAHKDWKLITKIPTAGGRQIQVFTNGDKYLYSMPGLLGSPTQVLYYKGSDGSLHEAGVTGKHSDAETIRKFSGGQGTVKLNENDAISEIPSSGLHLIKDLLPDVTHTYKPAKSGAATDFISFAKKSTDPEKTEPTVVAKASSEEIEKALSEGKNEPWAKGHQHFIAFPSAKREALFDWAANHVFNLGKHVPATAAFTHPISKKPWSVQQLVPDARHLSETSKSEQAKILNPQDHNLVKLGLMDAIMGNNDRHATNLLVDKTGTLKLIDNGFSMDYNDAVSHNTPAYLAMSSGVDQHITEDNRKKLHEYLTDTVGPDKMLHIKEKMKKMGVPEMLVNTFEKRANKAINLLSDKQSITPSALMGNVFNVKPETETSDTTGTHLKNMPKNPFLDETKIVTKPEDYKTTVKEPEEKTKVPLKTTDKVNKG